MKRAPALVFLSALTLAAAYWLAPPARGQGTLPPPDSTYLATWSPSIAPNDLAANPEDGTLAVVDAGHGSIEILRPGGRHRAFIEGFRDPRCAAFLPGGILLVGEAAGGTVKGYRPDGRVALILGKPSGEFLTPNDIAVDPAGGRAFVVDSAAHTVKAYSLSDGSFQFQFGSAGSAPGELLWPVSAAVSESLGEVFVGDSRNRRISVFDSSYGIFRRTIGAPGKNDGDISFVGGLHVDGLGRVFAVESLGGFVQIYTPDGAFIGKVGEHGVAPGQLRTPKAVAIDRYNRLLVSSLLDNRIEVWGLDTFQNPLDPDLTATAGATPSHLSPGLPSFQVFVEIAGVDPTAIDPSTLRLNGSVEPEAGSYRFGQRLSMRFATSLALATVAPGSSGGVVFALTGRTKDGEPFQASIPVVIISPLQGPAEGATP